MELAFICVRSDRQIDLRSGKVNKTAVAEKKNKSLGDNTAANTPASKGARIFDD